MHAVVCVVVYVSLYIPTAIQPSYLLLIITELTGWRARHPATLWSHSHQRRRGHRGPDTAIFDLQGSTKVFDLCNNCYSDEGREEGNEREDPSSIS